MDGNLIYILLLIVWGLSKLFGSKSKKKKPASVPAPASDASLTLKEALREIQEAFNPATQPAEDVLVTEPASKVYRTQPALVRPHSREHLTEDAFERDPVFTGDHFVDLEKQRTFNDPFETHPELVTKTASWIKPSSKISDPYKVTSIKARHTINLRKMDSTSLQQAFVLSTIFGKPRCRHPHRGPE